MARKKYIYEIFGMILLMVAIISFSVAVTINFRPLYLFDINYLSILTYTDLTQAQLLENYDQLMHYLNNPFIDTLKLPDFPVSESGAFHFYEVKRLFLFDYLVLIITGIPALIFLRQLVKNQRLWRLIQPLKWCIALPVVFLSLMAVGFDRFFVFFHELFFNNDDWLFNPITDPIIMVLPEEYFLHCFLLFFLLLEVLFLLLFFVAKKELKKND